jgi:hypothetical protein
MSIQIELADDTSMGGAAIRCRIAFPVRGYS